MVAVSEMSDLTLEKLRIAERLVSLEETHKQTARLLEKIAGTVYGNGHDGLTTRMSNNERGLRVLNAVMWSMAVTLISLGMRTVFEKLVLGVG